MSDIQFVADSLYLLVSDMGDLSRFHVGLLLAKGPSGGVKFQAINGVHTNHQWVFERKQSDRVSTSVTLLLALKIGIVGPDLYEPLEERLAAVPLAGTAQYGQSDCAVWMKQALDDLDDRGFIKLIASSSDIELEAKEYAYENKIGKVRSVIDSKYCLD